MEISKNFKGAKRANKFEFLVARTKTYGARYIYIL